MNNMISVPVIASFSTDGKIMPLYFRYKDHGSISVTMKNFIKCVTYHQFTCESEIDGIIQQICLIYYWNENKWYLTK